MQMQLAFRDSGKVLGHRTVSMVAGFVSTLPGILPAEGIAEFRVLTGPDGKITGLAPTGASYQPDQYRREPEYLSCAMGSFVTQPFWQIPQHIDVMQIYCREVRMPAADPLIGQVYAAEGLMALNYGAEPDFERISVFEGPACEGMALKGFLGQDINQDWDIPPMVAATRGNSLAQFFKMPLWGWGEKPVGMIATMHPKVCDAMDDYRWKPQAEWSPGLEDGLRRWGLLWPKQEQFKATTDLIRSRYPGYLEGRRSSGVETRAEENLMAERMKEALRQVLDREDSLSP